MNDELKPVRKILIVDPHQERLRHLLTSRPLEAIERPPEIQKVQPMNSPIVVKMNRYIRRAHKKR